MTSGERFLQAVLLTFALGVGPMVHAQATLAAEQAADESTARPNIVVFLADDLGYTDIAPFGSEINTPTLTALAAQGVSFTNYHTAANCAPARAV